LNTQNFLGKILTDFNRSTAAGWRGLQLQGSSLSNTVFSPSPTEAICFSRSSISFHLFTVFVGALIYCVYVCVSPFYYSTFKHYCLLF